MKSRIFVVFSSIILLTSGYIIDYGPVVKATKGAIWPKPKTQVSGANFYSIRGNFNFESVGNTCDILENALIRYKRLIFNQLRRSRNRASNFQVYKNLKSGPEYVGQLDVLKIDLRSKCEKMPYLGMDESYELSISESQAILKSFSIWGILRGLESFSQLLYAADGNARSLFINDTQVSDEPKFPHRGLLIDTSRHFISMTTLERILDGMVYNKLNVFHWHLTDDHSFPYQSIKYPEMTKGAYHESMIYSQQNVAEIIEFARQRGIRVLVEIDTPGHTASWGASHPELLTKCGGPYEGKLGPINPIVDSNYDFIFNLFEEIVQVFPDKYTHLGGDEVEFECWSTNQEILDYMKNFNMTTFEQLEGFYIQKLIDMITRLKHSSIVWQEVYTNGARLPSGTVVHVWTGDQKRLLSKITRDGLHAILSACWYLDHLSTGGDWVKFYKCDPLDFPGSDTQKKMVFGGEACMWAEVVDDTNILQRIFPRVCATAEKLWSPADNLNVDEAMQRLEEHYCRLRARNIPAQPPNGPGLCL